MSEIDEMMAAHGYAKWSDEQRRQARLIETQARGQLDKLIEVKSALESAKARLEAKNAEIAASTALNDALTAAIAAARARILGA
jgi:multidrug efflux pump subunit AcrA (membrane-fusion protein)